MEPCLDRIDPPHKPWLVFKYDYKSGALRRAERARTIGGPIRSSKRLRGINAETSDSVKDEHPTSHILSQASKRQKGPEEPDSDKEEVRRKLKRIKEEWNQKKAELDQLDRQLSQLDRPSHPPKEGTVTIGDWNGCTIELD
ncbi:hypothetical protein OF83DRAFT_932531 [Amylostereum chailletii]|nr:hypothetical protein OF83DRAFT_932531 [Amylostereum chailletii]